MRRHLTTIHNQFRGLYNPAPGEPFAMEIEFKITSDNCSSRGHWIAGEGWPETRH